MGMIDSELEPVFGCLPENQMKHLFEDDIAINPCPVVCCISGRVFKEHLFF